MTNLPVLTASSGDSSVVLATALEIAIQNNAVCCGKDSALEETMVSKPGNLKELNAKLEDRYRWGNTQRFVIQAKYIPQSSIDSDLILGSLFNRHALLMEWKSHFYVLYGAVFNETLYHSGARHYAIVKLLLLDPQFAGPGREVVFNRETDDLGRVQGLLAVTVM